jgi:prepilin-type N-terminal cleavage/methylation domain-containing protein
MRLPSPQRSSEAGFTLVELLVYISLLGVVLTIVGGILISSTSAEKSVRGIAEATDVAQLVSLSVEKGVRNSVALKLTSTDAMQFFAVKTPGAQTSVAWSCQAWYYIEADDALYTTTSPARLDPPATVAQRVTWMLLGTGVRPASAARIFTEAGATGVDLNFQVDAGDTDPVSIQTTVFSRGVPPDPATSALACF